MRRALYGTGGAFGHIALAMVVVAVSIGAFGPRTNKLELEELAAN
jgi:hypothetical protein